MSRTKPDFMNVVQSANGDPIYILEKFYKQAVAPLESNEDKIEDRRPVGWPEKMKAHLDAYFYVVEDKFNYQRDTEKLAEKVIVSEVTSLYNFIEKSRRSERNIEGARLVKEANKLGEESEEIGQKDPYLGTVIQYIARKYARQMDKSDEQVRQMFEEMRKDYEKKVSSS